MKKISRYKNRFTARAVVVLLAAFALAGCVRDDLDYGGISGSNDALVEFSIRVPGNSLPSTRALGRSDENKVATVDILAFDNTSGNFLYHRTVTEDKITVSDSKGKFKVTLPRNSDAVRFVFLANASQILSAEYGTGEITAADNYDDLWKKLKLSGDQWNATPGSTGYKHIPMWGETSFVVDGTNPTDDINLIRMLARINVTSGTADFKLEEVYLYNAMTDGYVIPDPDNMQTGSATTVKTPTLDDSWVRNLTAAYNYIEIEETGNITACENQIYTFETPIGIPGIVGSADYNKNNTFLVIGGRYKDSGVTTWFRLDIAQETSKGSHSFEYLPLLRNHSYNFTIENIEGAGYLTHGEAAAALPVNSYVNLDVQDDSDLRYYAWDDQFFLATEDKSIEYPTEGGDYKLLVKTDYPAGWSAVVSDHISDADYGHPDDWLQLTVSSGGENILTTENLEFTVKRNTDGPRTAYIHITAGRLSLVVTVHQEYIFKIWWDNITPIKYGYVGAFWKADQTGERLIRIIYDEANSLNTSNPSILGAWTATVAVGAEWIVLDAEQPSGVVEWNGGSNPTNMNNDDALHQITGNAMTVSGVCDSSNPIYFRVGLKSKWSDQAEYDPDDAPARYGVILLSYNDNNLETLILVRQGEDADFLMRPEDNNTAGTLHTLTNGTAAKPRPDAAKWSPYNLTAQFYKDNPTTTTDRYQVNVKDGTEVDYPSQGGAFFFFAGPSGSERYAYHPAMAGTHVGTTSSQGYWSALAAVHETCPDGYRRPTDGITTGDNDTGGLTNSEMRQSLYLNPPEGFALHPVENTLWGYYADGYFDRREVDNLSNFGVNSSTTIGAYIGQLFYNPNNYASLFLPAAGHRTTDKLYREEQCSFWSSSAAGNGVRGLYTSMRRTEMAYHIGNRNWGYSIRCVRDGNN